MRRRAPFVAVAISVATMPFLVSSAVAADTTLGENFTPTGSCSAGPFTVMQIASAAPSYTVASSGVITSWRTTSASGVVLRALKVARAAVGGQYTFVGGSDVAAVTAGSPFSQNVRIPVKLGDVIGMYIGDTTNCASSGTAAGDGLALFDGNPAPGTTAPPTALQPTSAPRLSVGATLEPDADNDGFGDTTQDLCPAQADTQGACRDFLAPETTVTKVTAKKIKGNKKKAKVTIAFGASEAATFACSVDGAAYSTCQSPFVLKLRRGTHNVNIRATDAAGNTDNTPVLATVKVKKAKQAKK
jgi:hypothetical protein